MPFFKSVKNILLNVMTYNYLYWKQLRHTVQYSLKYRLDLYIKYFSSLYDRIMNKSLIHAIFII